MLKLNLSTDSRWIDLAGGVRIKVKPLTSAMMLAARSNPRVEALAHADAAVPDDAVALEVAKIIGGMLIEDWEGVGDAEGAPVDVSQDWIDALLDLWPMFEAFQVNVVAGAMLVDAEKNASAPLLNGSSAGAVTTAKAAKAPAQNAREH